MRITFKLSFILITMIALGCENEFLDEPTAKGINSHSYKVNGNRMVKGWISPPNPSAGQIGYNRLGEFCLDAYLMADIEGDRIYPMGIVRWIISQPDNISSLPKTFPLVGYSNVMELLNGVIDPSNCYIQFTYYPYTQYTTKEYSNIINGNLVITRYDSGICSGTFRFEITNGSDTLSVSNGIFDYVVEEYEWVEL